MVQGRADAPCATLEHGALESPLAASVVQHMYKSTADTSAAAMLLRKCQRLASMMSTVDIVEARLSCRCHHWSAGAGQKIAGCSVPGVHGDGALGLAGHIPRDGPWQLSKCTKLSSQLHPMDFRRWGWIIRQCIDAPPCNISLARARQILII